MSQAIESTNQVVEVALLVVPALVGGAVYLAAIGLCACRSCSWWPGGSRAGSGGFDANGYLRHFAQYGHRPRWGAPGPARGRAAA